jgi:hypothetical protein
VWDASRKCACWPAQLGRAQSHRKKWDVGCSRSLTARMYGESVWSSSLRTSLAVGWSCKQAAGCGQSASSTPKPLVRPAAAQHPHLAEAVERVERSGRASRVATHPGLNIVHPAPACKDGKPKQGTTLAVSKNQRLQAALVQAALGRSVHIAAGSLLRFSSLAATHCSYISSTSSS